MASIRAASWFVVGILLGLLALPGIQAQPPEIFTDGFETGDLEFLWPGDDPIQVDVAEGAIDERRLGWLRGRVLDRTGVAVPGVRVRVLDHDELGHTHSRADGVFDLVLNGGGSVVLEFERSDYLAVQREIRLAWRESAWLDDVVLTALDPVVTTIASGAAEVQTVRGTPQTDLAGTRTTTLLFPSGVSAEAVLADGTRVPLPTLDVRATEYTVGPEGLGAMPASLPANVGYTYAVELSVDGAPSCLSASRLRARPCPKACSGWKRRWSRQVCATRKASRPSRTSPGTSS